MFNGIDEGTLGPPHFLLNHHPINVPPVSGALRGPNDSPGQGAVVGKPPWIMPPKAVLSCRPNSHGFQDRTVSLETPCKIGRSVARSRPSPNNAIFDCKVLSRNHALLWYENGKFFLQDTKSSNGTFINNNRLSKSSEESTPREVCSGDILQFGVDVMELNKKADPDDSIGKKGNFIKIPGTITHGCIVANLQIFLPDGKEAKASSSTVLPDKPITTTVQEMYKLNQYIKEASQREQMLQNKLLAMTKLLASTTEATESSWKSLIQEDRLLSRVETLERQLQISHKSMTEDKLKMEVATLIDEKEKYEACAKEALRKAHQEKMEVVRRYAEIESNLKNIEDEKRILKDICDRTNEEIQALAAKYEQSELKSKEMGDEMDQSSAKYKEEVENLNKQLLTEKETLGQKDKIIDSLLEKVDMDKKPNLANNKEGIILKSDLKDEMEEIEREGPHSPLASRWPNSVLYLDGDCNMNLNWEPKVDSSDIESLKSQLKAIEGERKEIQSKLSLLLGLFDDLKVVSKKVQVSEYLTELINKIDIEIRQIKNFTTQQPSLESEPIHNNINNDVGAVEENHINLRYNMEKSYLEELLEESRQKVGELQMEMSAANKENGEYEEKLSQYVLQLEIYKAQVESLRGVNEEIQSQLALVQNKLHLSERAFTELQERSEDQKEISLAKDNVIQQLKVNCRYMSDALEAAEEGEKAEGRNDLRSLHSTHVACQTAYDNLSYVGAPLTFNDFSPDSSSIDSSLISASEKLSRAEEELAIFKDRFSQCHSEKEAINRQFTEYKAGHEALFNQPNMVTIGLAFLFVLILAIMIQFRPS